MKSLGSFALGLITGAALGVGAGLLFAPGEGKQVRSRLSYQLSRLREQLQERFSQKTKEEDLLFNDAKNESDELTKSTKRKANKLTEDLNKLLTEQGGETSNANKTKKK
ncbi:MAG: YtxH domain-containing protein [Bacteroidetes bacterium]|nr:MAG: YtxH domain-containing protein [Bacteroidota bacterium]TAG89577.1 MAG: YtxH domain-containing protein [Bacteroidota bacterium]